MPEDSGRKGGGDPAASKKGAAGTVVPGAAKQQGAVPAPVAKPPSGAPAPVPPIGSGSSPVVIEAPLGETPFAAGEDEWESELAAWDAAIPIVSRGPIVSPATVVGGSGATHSPGALPDEENPFSDTPTTVVSPGDHLDLDDLPEVVSAGAFDDGFAPASGSYAALVATDQSAPGIFDREPTPETRPPLPTDTLREMTAAPWGEDIASLIVLGDQGRVTPPTRAYWETLGRILVEERALAPEKSRMAALCLACGRVADLLGHPKEALAHVEAALGADVAAPAAHRAVLGLAERSGRMDDDAVAESLSRLALMPHPDQPYYRALHAEWILARAGRGVVDGTAAAAITTLPDGLGRMLAETELAWTDPPAAAAILEGAAHRVGGGLGAALLLIAAGLNEVANDFQAAAEQRFVAARLDDQRPLLSLAVLRDLARVEADAVVPALEELIARVPASSLRVALARWGASAALRAGDKARAWRFVGEAAAADGATTTAGLVRDRMDLWPGAPARSTARRADVVDSPQALLAPVSAIWDSAPARAVLALRACELATTSDEIAFAIAAAEDATRHSSASASPSAALAPAIEELAKRGSDAPSRVRALRLWRRIDPARWISASLDLADALVPTPEKDAAVQGPESTESVLGEIASRDGASPIFWSLAALEARRGRFIAAAAHIDQGLERPAWRDSPLAIPLAELAAELTARADMGAGVARMMASLRTKPVAAEMPRRTLGRMLRQLGDRDLWADFVEAELTISPTPHRSERARARRVAQLLEPVFWRSDGGDGEDVPSLVAAALDVFPLHPVAFGLALCGQPEPVTLVDRLLAGSSGPAGATWTLTAAVAAAVADDVPRALALARGIDAGGVGNDAHVGVGDASSTVGCPSAQVPPSLAVALKNTIRRLAWAAPTSEERVRLIQGLEGVPAPVDLLIRGHDEGAPDRLRSLLESARAQDWEAVVAALVDMPPHEVCAGAGTLTLAALIDEGRCQDRRASEIWRRARAALVPQADAADTTIDASEPAALLRAADRADANTTEAGAALERLATVAAGAPDPRSAALFLVEAARQLSASGEGAPPGPSDVERCLRAAAAADPTSAPAAIAWRRWLSEAGRVEDAARAYAAEAEALVDLRSRLQALLRAAAMLVTPVGMQARVGPAAGDPGRVTRAATFLHRALELAPQDHEAFTRLRDLYEEAARHADLAKLLARRMEVTSNPFEVTALRLTRADIFAGPLEDHAAAKAELEAILQKEPQHTRALARLADLEGEDGNHVAAADLLIRRAFIERSPEKLRDLFLRLGRIYTQQLPDAKRGVGAYARVLQVDPNNREALDELSRLYLGLGETKSAIAITERLIQMETTAERRSGYHVRLGQLFERAADPRAAGIHFRRAAEDAPRDIEALAELMRHLDKTRDTAGRRAYLDRAAGELRAAVLARPSDLAAIETLGAVLRWRGRAASAAAAAELTAFVGARGGPGTSMALALPAWAVPPPSGRSLAALAKPSVDEQTFPEAVLPSIRHLFRLLAPTLWEGRSDLSRYGVERADRIAAGKAPRDVFETVAAELAAGAFDLYVGPARDAFGAVSLAVEPGKPPAIIMGASLIKLGPQAVRFAAARTLRLIATHLDVALWGANSELALWLGAVIRQFVPEYTHADAPPDLLAERTVRVAKLIPRRHRQEIMPFAMESSGPLDLHALRAGIRDAANRVGLLASGSLASALHVVLATSNPRATPAAGGIDSLPATLERHPETQALLAFALSDDYDDLVKALE